MGTLAEISQTRQESLNEIATWPFHGGISLRKHGVLELAMVAQSNYAYGE